MLAFLGRARSARHIVEDELNRYSNKIRQLLIHMIDDDEDACGLFGGSAGLRHFDALEEHALTPDARGYLMELSRCGSIPNEQRELIIHYASQMGGEPLDRLDVEELVDHLVFAFPDSDDLQDSFPRARPH